MKVLYIKSGTDVSSRTKKESKVFISLMLLINVINNEQDFYFQPTNSLFKKTYPETFYSHLKYRVKQWDA